MLPRFACLTTLCLLAIGCGDDTVGASGTDGSSSSSGSTTATTETPTTSGGPSSTSDDTTGGTTETPTSSSTTDDGTTGSSSGTTGGTTMDTEGDSSSTGDETTGGQAQMPPCDPTWIGPTCDRQFMLSSIVGTAVDGDTVYMVDDGAVLTLDRVSGQVDVLSTASDRSNQGAMVGSGPPLPSFGYHMVLSSDATALYIADDDERSILAVDVATGDRTVLSDDSDAYAGGAEVGTGVPLVGTNAIGWDPVSNRILVADSDADRLVAVDVTTGNRTIVSDSSDDGPGFAVPRAVAVDTDDGTIYVYEQNLASMYAVDPDTGTRTVISDNSDSSNGGAMVGTGFSLTGGRTMVYEPDSGLLFMTNTEFNAVVTVDPATGDRAVFSEPEPAEGDPVGDGSNLMYPFAMSLGNGELIVDDSAQRVLTTVDLTTGDRAVMLSSRLGTGYRPGNGPEDVGHVDGTLYLCLTSERKIVSMPLDTLERTVLVDNDGIAGSGPVPDLVEACDVDAATNAAYFVDWQQDALYWVDLSTGERAVVSDNAGPNAVGAGPGFDQPQAVNVDSSSGVAYVLDRGRNAVVRVYLAAGDRVVLSDDSDSSNGGAMVGTGPGFFSPVDMAFDATGQRLFVVDGARNAVMAVELSAGNVGNRTVFSDDDDDGAAVGAGPGFVNPQSIIVDAERGRLLVTDGSDGDIVAVDLTSGDRTLVSSSSQSPGSGWGLSAARVGTVVDDVLYAVDRSDGLVMTVAMEGDDAGYREVIASGTTEHSY